MGKGSGVCKVILIIFILFLLIQVSCAAEENDKTNMNLNGTIIGTINGTINGAIDNAINNTTDGITSNIRTSQWILLLPIFYGNLLFLSWMSRFFNKMNFCFVIFILVVLLVLLMSFYFPLMEIFHQLVLPASFIIIFLIVIAILREIFLKRRKKEEYNRIIDKDSAIIGKYYPIIGEDDLIVGLHDIVRSFIIILTGLMWPMILFYYYWEKVDYVAFYGIEKLKFPVYIIAASSIGILSYLFLSVEDTFGHLIPAYKEISIAWSYLRRITIAPFIALIGFYLLNHLQGIKEMNDINDYFVFIFSFFAGVFTKTVEEWIYAWVQKLLPGDKKSEFDARTEYEVKESEFVKKLQFDEDLAYALYNAKVRTIEELAACDPNNLKNRLNFDIRKLGEQMGLSLTEQKERFDSYSERQIKLYIDRAQTYMDIDKSEFVTKLKMDRDLAFELYYFANIKTLEDLKNCDPREVHDRICNCKIEAEELAKHEKIDIERAHEMLCKCSEENIKRFIERAKCELKLKNNVENRPNKENEDQMHDQ